MSKDSPAAGSPSAGGPAPRLDDAKLATEVALLASNELQPENATLDCLQVCDMTSELMPVHMRQLLRSSHSYTSADLLCLLVYAVALESGFVNAAHCASCSDYITGVLGTSSYHSCNVRRLSLLTPPHIQPNDKSLYTVELQSIVEGLPSEMVSTETPNTSPPKDQPSETKETEQTDPLQQLRSRLTARVTGDLMIVTLSPHPYTESPGRSLCLSIPRYILNTPSTGQPPRFHKLSELSNRLREELFVPVRNEQLLALGVQLYPSLLGLPVELYDQIFQHLNSNQLHIMANVNWRLNSLVAFSKHSAPKIKQKTPKRPKFGL